MRIESKTGCSANPVSNIYSFISDFRNFNNFIPVDKVTDWQAEMDHCTFRLDMLGKFKLNIIEKQENKLIKITSDPGESQYNFNLWIQFRELAQDDTRIKITMEPLINQFLMSMVKSPLKKFADSLIEEIENFKFPQTH